MKFNWINKATTILLSSVLVGGVVTSTIPVLTTQAQAESLEDAPISYKVFKSDENAVKKAVKTSSSAVKQQLNAAFFKRMEKHPVNAYGYAISPYFSQAMAAMASHAVSELGRKGQVTPAFKRDYKAMIAVYDQFKGRLEPVYQGVIDDYIDDANQQISKNKVDSDNISDISGYFDQYFLQDIRPTKITGMQRVKSSITKLTAKKASKKYVKVTGTVTLGKKANYAQIKTYKGTRYAKLKGAHSFNKKIYAPKAKRVSATVGYYTHGHFSKVTAVKSVHVK